MHSIIHLSSCKAVLEVFEKEPTGLGYLSPVLSQHEAQPLVGHLYLSGRGQ